MLKVESIRNSRFDIDGDGRVDFLNFLQFFFSKVCVYAVSSVVVIVSTFEFPQCCTAFTIQENKEKRSAVRVSSAIDVLRNYILSLQKVRSTYICSDGGWLSGRSI